MVEEEQIKEVSRKLVIVKEALQNLYSSVDAIHLLLSADHSIGLLQSEFDDLKKENERLQNQLAALEQEHIQLEKEHSDRSQYLAEKEKKITGLHNVIEKAIIALDQTGKIFKSKTMAKIREDLIDCRPSGSPPPPPHTPYFGG